MFYIKYYEHLHGTSKTSIRVCFGRYTKGEYENNLVYNANRSIA
ncbi:unnamed protein product, partial [Rotaria magnacalcarata]